MLSSYVAHPSGGKRIFEHRPCKIPRCEPVTGPCETELHRMVVWSSAAGDKWRLSVIPEMDRTSRQTAIERQRFGMYSVEGLDVVGDKMNQLSHDGLHTCWVAGCIGCLQEHSVKPFVIWADSQTLAGRPLGVTSVELL